MKYTVYPYTEEIEYLPRLLSDGKDTTADAAAPRAWRRRPDFPKDIKDFEDALKGSDVLLLADTPSTDLLYQDLKARALQALSRGIAVRSAVTFTGKDLEELQAAAAETGSRLELPPNPKQEDDYISEVYHRQQSIVVAVGALTQGLSTEWTAASLAGSLRKQGLETVLVSPHSNAGLLGGCCYSMDSILQAGNPQEQVQAVNNLLWRLQTRRQPDILLVELPDAMQMFTDLCPGSYGIWTYLVTRAMQIDYLVLVSPAEDLNQSGFEEMSMEFRFRYGAPIDAVIIRDRTIDRAASREEERVMYEKTDPELMEAYLAELQEQEKDTMRFYTADRPAEIERLTEQMIRTLSEEEAQEQYVV